MNSITSISAFHQLIGLPSPSHPLVSVIRLDQISLVYGAHWQEFQSNYYSIALKRDVSCKMIYGQQYYDFDKGIMSFTAPGQVQSLQADQIEQAKGYVLLFHPDFLVGHPFAELIKGYGFFSYAVNEALHLSDREEANIIALLEKIDTEILHIDGHTQEITLSYIDLLLSYSKRFFERQFLTRKKINHDLLEKFQQVVAEYFASQAVHQGLPTVHYVAQRLNLSPDYLSDMLRAHTGQNAQQHLQFAIIDKAKHLLGFTTMSVSEIAYSLGFQYPQSLNKLFKSKTNVSPLQYRNSLN